MSVERKVHHVMEPSTFAGIQPAIDAMPAVGLGVPQGLPGIVAKGNAVAWEHSPDYVPDPPTPEHYHLRRGPVTPPIVRKVREIQAQCWGDNATLELKPHLSKLEIAKAEALAQRLNRGASQDEQAVSKLVTMVFTNVLQAYGIVQVLDSAPQRVPSTASPPLSPRQTAVVRRFVKSVFLSVVQSADNPFELRVHRSRLEVEKDHAGCDREVPAGTTRPHMSAADRHAQMWAGTTPSLSEGFQKPMSRIEREKLAWQEKERKLQSTGHDRGQA